MKKAKFVTMGTVWKCPIVIFDAKNNCFIFYIHKNNMFTKKNGIFICTQVTLAESASDALLDIMDFRISQLENVYHATAILLGV